MLRLRHVLTGLGMAIAGISAHAAPGDNTIGVNVLLNQSPTTAVLADIARLGRVRDVIPPIQALTMLVRERDLAAIRALPYVAAANPDAERNAGPIDTVPQVDMSAGRSTWNLDVVDVTDAGAGRTVAHDGRGVYVAVLDTGLHDNWRQYFPQERIASHFGKSFAGGGGENGSVSSQPNKWEHDQNGHGTHVTSTVLGYSLRGTAINGVAPNTTVIPVKVLNQNGSGWSSMIAQGIVYVADLKANGYLGASPVVINMSLGGSVLDAIEKAAIDYAIGKGVVIVASAGNAGNAGMGFPGAYAPVISVAASGWTGAWVGAANWWITGNVPDPTVVQDAYIADFSSRALPGQELDVTAPGDWVVGPYQTNGQISYYFLSGTSMAAPHVTGVAALMLQKNPTLNQAQVEAALKASALPLPAGCRAITTPVGTTRNTCWGANATGAGIVTAPAALAATP